MNPYQVDVMGGNGKTIRWDNKVAGGHPFKGESREKTPLLTEKISFFA